MTIRYTILLLQKRLFLKKFLTVGFLHWWIFFFYQSCISFTQCRCATSRPFSSKMIIFSNYWNSKFLRQFLGRKSSKIKKGIPFCNILNKFLEKCDCFLLNTTKLIYFITSDISSQRLYKECKCTSRVSDHVRLFNLSSGIHSVRIILWNRLNNAGSIFWLINELECFRFLKRIFWFLKV